MLHAQLKGKCPELDNMEDILTSTIFGYLELTDDIEWLKNILKDSIDGDTLLISNFIKNAGEKNSVDFHFWPIMYDDTEPDLLIKCKSENKTLPIMIEVKLYSYLSNSNQLLTEYKNLVNKNSKFLHDLNYEKGILVYLTKNDILYKKEFEKSKLKIKDIYDDSFKFIHITWQEFYKSINALYSDNYYNKIFGKILRCLKHYGLDPFEGFEDINERIDEDNYYKFNTSFNWNIKDIESTTWRFKNG